MIRKLSWADQYSLANLQDACIRSFADIEEIEKLKTTEEYRNLSDASKLALVEKMLDLK